MLLLFNIVIVRSVYGQLPFGKGHIKLPGQSLLPSLLPPSGATISKSDDKYLIKAHVGPNEVKFLRLGDDKAAISTPLSSSLQPAVATAPQVSPTILVSRIVIYLESLLCPG